jgi:hypothetical protein
MTETITETHRSAYGLKRSLRAGLILLAGLQAVVSLWQYFLPESFFDHFPTVRLDPPFNEHLLSDVGGLGLALTTTVVIAAVTLDHKVVVTALTAYAIYAATHFSFHVTHVEHFAPRDAVGVGTGLGVEVALALALLIVAQRIRRIEAVPPPA